MTWTRDAYGVAPYSSGEVANTAPPGQQIPPPIPGGTTSYTYGVQSGAYPWGRRSWAGGLTAPTWPGGGIVIAPDPVVGVMRVTAWWPDAAQLQLVRLSSDGSRVPVRGGYPLTTAIPTRRNWATNPSLETGLNGYVAGTGTPTLSRIARTDGVSAAGSWAGRAVNASAGTSEITVPHALPSAVAFGIGIDLKFGATPTAVTITVGWNNAAGGALTASTITLTSGQINQSVGQFARQTGTVTPPALAATVASIKVAATGMPAGGQMDWDRVMFDPGGDTSYFDGAILGGTWLGTAHLSGSLLAPVLTVVDGECPLDVPVYYELYNPAITGGRMTSPEATLESGGRTWMTHPAAASAPVVIDLRASPTLTRGVEQGVFYPLGGEFPVVVSASRRRAPVGTVAINAISRAERDALLALFDDVSPVLVRCPDEYGYDPQMWLSLGELTEDREGRKAWQDAWLLSAPFYQVAAPDPSLVA